MKKYKQFHKELTTPSEQTDIFRLILIILFFVIGVAFLFAKEMFPLGIVFLFVAGGAGVAHIHRRRYFQQLLVLQDRVQVYSRGGQIKKRRLLL